MVARKEIRKESFAAQVSDNLSDKPPACRTIPLRDVVFHPHSFADDAGRLFRWNARLWRGISYEQAPFFDKLLRDGVIQGLVDRGLLIESEATTFALDGYGMVVSHRSVPFVSYPNEWCAGMLKDASLTILDLAIELTKRHLILRDAHPWNVLFDWVRPVYVDLTSIAPLKDRSTWCAYDEFCRFCYYPLILMSLGQERIARSLLPEYEGILRSELLTLTRGSVPSRLVIATILRRGFNSFLSRVNRGPSGSELSFLKQARRRLEAIQLPSYRRRHRQRLRESMVSLSWQAEGTPLSLALRKILARLSPATVLDMSRGPLWTTLVPATMGFNVVSTDPDAARISALYETARNKNLSILPLMMDFIKPTPSVGYPNHYSMAATERLKCDLVLAFGLTDRIAIENHFSFDLIAEGLASFSKRWLVVGVGEGENGEPVVKPEGFIAAFSKRFRDVTVVPSGGQSGTLLVCEK